MPTPIDLTSQARIDEARKLFNEAAAGDRSRWGTLWSRMKTWKRNWKALGFTDKEIERIKLNKPDWI